jgi:hypothetical protein
MCRNCRGILYELVERDKRKEESSTIEATGSAETMEVTRMMEKLVLVGWLLIFGHVLNDTVI